MTPQQKVDFAKSKNADLLISFHVDGEPATKGIKSSGMSFWVAKDEFANSANSKVLATAIINEFSNNCGIPVMPEINQRQNGVWILQAPSCPALLIETGFITNEKDVSYLKTNAAKETIAKNVLAGIEKYLTRKPYTIVNTTLTNTFINVKYSDTNYTKSSDFKNKALVIIDSKEVGNLGNKFIEDGHVKYSTITIYKPSEAKKIFGDKGQYGAIKLTQKEAVFISAKSIYFDAKSGSVKLLGPDIRLKGDFSDALINVEGKIITAKELKTIDPKKISSINVLKGDKLNDITEAKSKKSVIYISLKADDLPEVFVQSSSKKAEPFIEIGRAHV